MLAVVKYVAIPPSAEPNEIGISSLLGRMCDLRATWIALGRSSAPTAMLMKPAIPTMTHLSC